MSRQTSHGQVPVTGVVLAGGQARRMGLLDKGLQPLAGRPLVAWVLERLKPQVEEVLINANRNGEAYATFGARVIHDRIGNFSGPLAGMHAALAEAKFDQVMFVPCDTPFLPHDLVLRMATPLAEANVDLSVAKAGGQRHPVVSVLRKRLLGHLEAFLEGGGRKVDAWYATLRAAEVRFADESAFRNINTLEDLRAAEHVMASAPPGQRLSGDLSEEE